MLPWEKYASAEPSMAQPQAQKPWEKYSGLQAGTADQHSGFIPTVEDIKNFIVPKKEQIPELAGTILGGIAGGIPGAAAGASLGALVTQAAKSKGLFQGQPAQTGADFSKDIGGAALRGGISQLVGDKVISPLVSKMATSFSGSVTPEITAQVQAAARAGITPPLSTMTQSPMVQGMERMVETGPFGGAITAQKKAAIAGLEDFANSISQSMGSKSTPEQITEMATNKLNLFEKSLDSTKDKLYDSVWPVLKDQKPQLTNTISTLENIIQRRSGELEPKQLSMMKGLLRRIKEVPEQTTEKFVGGIMPEKIVEKIPGKESSISTVEQLRNTKSNIGQMVKEGFNDPALTGIKTELKNLYGAISSDIDATASKFGIGNELIKANEVYKQGIEKLQQPIVNAIENRAKLNPNHLFEVVIKNDNPTLIKAGKEILGEDGFNFVRKQWFDDIVRRSTKIIEGTEQISPQLLANNLKKTGSSLPEIIGNDGKLGQKLNDFMDVSKMLTRGNKVTGGSQTAYLLRDLKYVRDIFMAPLVRSEAGRQLLTTGFPGAGKLASPIGAYTSDTKLQNMNQGKQ